MSTDNQFDLFEADITAAAPSVEWPSAERFPLNLPGRSTGSIIERDLFAASDALIVTGYTSLGRLISFLGCLSSERQQPLRLLIGAEPHPTARTDFNLQGHDLPDEIRRFWLARGISLRLSGLLLKVMEDLRSGVIEARFMPRSYGMLHAKIYCADDISTLGSSNFSDAGLAHNLEANARFSARDSRRSSELRQIAENYWSMGKNYNDALLGLLEQLLKIVSWEEALARACAELLEGRWAEDYLRHYGLGQGEELWPSQVRGIAQALMLLRQVGSVLVADATGSGKTRMGVHLIRALMQQIWSSSRQRKGAPIMVCPPLVKLSWEREAEHCGLPLTTTSHGMLSQRSSEDVDLMLKRLSSAQILAVDEAHNFLNLASQRTQAILRNLADHTLLFTATPINRSSVDLLRIADLIGADNLAPQTLKMFERLLGRRRLNRSLSEGERQALQHEIARFTVRRTKSQLNAMIDEQPEAYQAAGNLCRYPNHQPHTYILDEPDSDRMAAAHVSELTDQLLGLNYLAGEIALPAALRRDGWTDEKYLASRLKGAHKLAAYMVRSRLRSSRAALLEYLRGTRHALEFFDLHEGFHKNSTGNVIDRLTRLEGHLPHNSLTDIELPEWLRDPEQHRIACEKEIAVYREVEKIIQDYLSDSREQRKAEQLYELLDDHDLVLAFDSCPITLALIRKLLKKLGDITVYIATGDPSSERREIATIFNPGSQDRRVIGLCSDSLAEGVNLQQASAVVNLDMPSVVRIAEQRIGRVDRMDSPHPRVDIYWPDDAEEFALTTDERFVERFETVENLLGSNITLPEHLLNANRGRPIDTNKLVQEFEQALAEDDWNEIEDAFAPVRGLIQGRLTLVSPEVYADMRQETARILSRVAIAPARRPWGFFCLRGDSERAPAWILIPAPDGKPILDLAEICTGLRDRLQPDMPTSPATEDHMRWLEPFLRRLVLAERERLPRKKRRALDEMRIILTHYQAKAAAEHRQDDLDLCQRLIRWLDSQNPEQMPDWEAMAERWLDLIRPVWYSALQKRRRKRPLRLSDLRSRLLNEDRIELADIRRTFSRIPRLPPVEERIAACILGVPMLREGRKPDV
ncbi:superfamily II DNA or RNA helicase [Methylohalomonas lacus]|uniref:Superfamily II DNA or RNA helicase n=1 Tax=Methylohalomonas lacus TaxID=398773 RepID=A0AAE3L1U8_9GAMM|nr:SNF2-related protein [Methylohalomonas lacus]MCS3904105.1 superfamily II DNA or RNA helicase [Methylohalomonas lacus]